MKLPLKITFRNMNPSGTIEDHVRERVERLERHHDRIMGCRVTVELPHRHRNKGERYNVRIDLTLPGKELVVKRVADPDAYVAVRDAFDVLQRRLEEHARRQRGEVKHHESLPYGRVIRIFPQEGYGFLETPDGREIYFHRNSVLNSGFDRLEVGAEVRFAEEAGEQGPQASTVTSVGKH